MKFLFPFLIVSTLLWSCNNRANDPAGATGPEQDSVQAFFPVTAYLQGEVFNLKRSGINPIRYITQDNKTDSSWLKLEELDSVVHEFLTPVIDSVNMAGLFSEKSFFDQSINSVTLTYEPIATLPDSITLTHWDVYINPKTQKVKRVYMVKEIDKNKTLQLTWVNDQWFKLTSVVTDSKGNAKVEKEEKYFWDF